MQVPSDSVARIVELEARQDAALRELEALEQRLEQVLNEHVQALGPLGLATGQNLDRAA
jgi:hypothetical protein